MQLPLTAYEFSTFALQTFRDVLFFHDAAAFSGVVGVL